MNTRRLLLRNLTHYWRTNLAVLLGVVAATAVIGGALVVGDSVRDSLKQMSLDRLGRIDHALHGGRFFREALAEVPFASDDLPESDRGDVAPALMMTGTVEHRSADADVRRAGRINVYGVDGRVWEMLETAGIEPPSPGEIVLNQRVAGQLGLERGDRVTLIVEIPAAIPRDALLGEREETVTALVLTVSDVAAEETGLARLGLNPTQQLPANVFVSLEELQSQTGLAAIPRTRRNPIAKPARVNTLFFSTRRAGWREPPDEGDLTFDRGADVPRSPEAISPAMARRLTGALHRHLTLEDLALRLVPNEEHGYLSLESEQMFLETGISELALHTAEEMALVTSPVLVYLVNEISSRRRRSTTRCTRSSPASI
jgi:putative ABC transport system permease protein